MTIITNRDSGFVLYERRSPRHNWHIASTADLERIRHLVPIFRAQAESTEGWEQFQQQIVYLHFDNGRIPDNLPRNVKWVHPHSDYPDVVCGISLPR